MSLAVLQTQLCSVELRAIGASCAVNRTRREHRGLVLRYVEFSRRLLNIRGTCSGRRSLSQSLFVCLLGSVNAWAGHSPSPFRSSSNDTGFRARSFARDWIPSLVILIPKLPDNGAHSFAATANQVCNILMDQLGLEANLLFVCDAIGLALF